MHGLVTREFRSVNSVTFYGVISTRSDPVPTSLFQSKWKLPLHQFPRRPIEEIFEAVAWATCRNKKVGFTSSPSLDSLQGASSGIDKIADGRRSLVLVVFVGGVTFAEISALRFLSSQEGMAYDLIIGTTKIVSGHTLVETFFETFG